MDDAQLTQFSGTSGKVLRGAMSLSTLVSGICLGFVLAAGHYVLAHYAHPKLATLWDLCVIATALARYAVNGLTGQFSGTIFSTEGGSWARVMAVAGRYAVLCLAWLVPLVLLAMSPDEARLAIFGALSGQSSMQLIGLIFLVVLGAGLTPPLFLIAAVGAEEFGDLIRAGHWRRLLGGRRTDLYAMYSIYAGALFVQTLIAIPITLVAFTRGPQVGKAVGAMLLAFLGGLSVSLLGRLCGFFAMRETENVPAEFQPGLAELEPGPPAFEPDSAEGEPLAAALPPRQPAEVQARQPAVSMVGQPAAAAAVFTVAKPVLGDAPARLQAIMKRSESDLPGAIEELQGLRAAHAPHPHVLKVLCLLLTKMARPAEAVEAANEALPLCFAKGYVPLAADMVRVLWAQREQLRLSRDQLAAVAAALHKAGDIAGAMRAFGALVSLDPSELRGVKGLMQMAEEQLRKGGDPRHAATIYNFLLKHCADSPLAEHMREGLSEAQRRQSKQAAAAGS